MDNELENELKDNEPTNDSNEESTITEEQRNVINYLEGCHFKEEIPEDYFTKFINDNKKDGATFSTSGYNDPKFDYASVKMYTTPDEVKLLLKSAENWIAGKLSYNEFSDIPEKGSAIDEAKVLYTAARLYCKKMKDSDQKREKDSNRQTSTRGTCLEKHELYSSALDILDNILDNIKYINENITGWV